MVGPTGAAPARLAQYDEIQSALPLVTVASVVLILLIVGLAFRSVGAPLVTLFAAAIAYLITVRVLPWLGERSGATVPAEVEPIVVVLLLGLVTDYSVFYLSETRRRLRLGEPRLVAARAAIARTTPMVLTAGLIVAAGTGALVVGKLRVLPRLRARAGGHDADRAAGRGDARARAHRAVRHAPVRHEHQGAHRAASEGPVPQTVADTHEIERTRHAVHADVPGPPEASSRLRLALTRPLLALRRTKRLAQEAQTTRWRVLIARVATAPPVALPIAIACLALLGVLAVHVSSTELGLGFLNGLPRDNQVREAATAASDGFAPGVLSPTEIDLEAPGIATRSAQLARLEDALRREPGVAAVIGPREQPAPPAPQIMVARDANAARVAVIFDSDPLGAPAIHKLEALRDRLPRLVAASGLGRPQVRVGGETAVAQETVDSVLNDLKRIGLVALAVNLLLLIIFLRALIAPLYLVAVSVLGLAASLGLTTLVFQEVLGHDDLTYYVPFAAAVLLVALGSDYNVFVAGRIWEEARWMRLREAIAVATPAAAKAVTVAGLALASSFALLALVPLRSFREFAFVMGAGVLLDTFVVRSLLVPALTSLFGEASWWPGRRVRTLSNQDIVERIADRAGLSLGEAQALTEGTLAALGERITPHERQVLAGHLPPRLRVSLDGDREAPARFPVDEFLSRARAASGGEDVSQDEMAEFAAAVLTTLEEAAPDDLAYVRTQLSADYDPLFRRQDLGAQTVEDLVADGSQDR